MTEKDPEWEKTIDRLRAAIDNDRMPSKLRDLLEEGLTAENVQALADEIRLPVDALRDRAAELEAKADAIEEVGQAFETFAEKVLEVLEYVDEHENAENRDDKGYARESIMDSLGALVEAFDEADGHELDDLLGDVPDFLPDWETEGDEVPRVARVVWENGVPRLFDQNGFDILPPEDRDGTPPLKEEVRVFHDGN